MEQDSIYRCEALGCVAERIARSGPQTTKGHVERMHGTLQDRLVKALRLVGINDMEPANEFLGKKFLPALNRQFEVKRASQADAHRGIPRELNQVLSWEEQRVVQKDWTVVCRNQWYQLDRQHEPLGLAGKKVIVRTLGNGVVQLESRGVKLRAPQTGDYTFYIAADDRGELWLSADAGLAFQRAGPPAPEFSSPRLFLQPDFRHSPLVRGVDHVPGCGRRAI